MRKLSGLLVTLMLLFGAVGVSAAPPVCKPHECGVPSPTPTPAPTPRPVDGMGRLVTSGAETNDTTIEGVTLTAGGTAATISTANARSGSRHFRTNAVATTSVIQYPVSATAGVTYYARAYIYSASDPGGASFQNIVRLVGAGSTTVVSVEAGNNSTIIGVPVTYPGYNRIELSWVWSGTNLTVAARVNGTTGTIFLSNDIQPTLLQIGWVGSAQFTNTNMDIDDVAINDSAGAAQNTWPGEGKEVLLLPVTDNATGTGWTLGTGTAAGTAVHTAVANTPPLGVADLTAGSDVKQVRNATANANVNVDQNMTTYSAAGIVAADTINVIDPITVTGAPVVTSAKLGTVGVVSNPAITNVNLAAGGTSGAFWSGVAAGTYPTGWKVSHGTVTYGSSVTVGTAPVMRVTQVTSSTRIAIVSFMGMYVDYTPAPAAFIPNASPYPQILPQ